MGINYSNLPEHMQDGMRRYIEHGILPGSFLTAVLANNLMMAVGHADSINLTRLQNYLRFLYEEAPSSCYGSTKTVREWRESGGLAGQGRL
jgi:hypothetical protein